MRYSIFIECIEGEPPVLKLVPDNDGLYFKEDEAELKELLHQWWINSSSCDGALDYVTRGFRAVMK